MGRCADCPFSTPAIDAPHLIRPAEIMVVGEAPGKTEVKKGEPFVGPSGKLLWETLKKFGIERDDCAITNAMSCYLPDSLYSKKGKALDEPIAACRGRLAAEIAQVKPKVILSLGGVALHAITGDHSLKITKERGAPRPLNGEVGRAVSAKLGMDDKLPDVLPTLHPAAVLRSPRDYKKLHSDVAQAINHARGYTLNPGVTHYDVATPETVKDWIEFLRPYRYLSFDIETFPDRRVLALGIGYDKNKVLIFPYETVDMVAKLFDDDGAHEWIAHNAKYDVKHLRRQFKYWVRLDHDTILMHYCLNEQKGTHDLSQLSTTILGATDYAEEFKKTLANRSDFSSGTREALFTYLSKDCDYTLQLFHHFKEHLEEKPSLWKLYTERLVPLTQFLLRVENNGAYVSKEALKELDERFTEELKEVEATIQKEVEGHWDQIEYMVETDAKSAPEEFNPGSWQQLKWVLYSSMGLTAGNGETNTEEETLKSLPQNDFVKAILAHRKIKKMHGTYVKGFARRMDYDGRIHANFLPYSTLTGRLSSTDPNMQNIPKRKDIRNLIQAPPGRILIDADLDQAELRTLANLSEDPNLIADFLSGMDFHTTTAKRIEVLLGRDPDRITKESPERRGAKAVNFGIAYGLTEFSLSNDLGISIGEARKLVEGWKATYPVAWAWLAAQREKPLKGQFLETRFGRRRRIHLLTNDSIHDSQNEASNFVIQSTANDINLDLAMRVEDRVLGASSMIINLVHDSILIEAPNNQFIIDKLCNILVDEIALISREFGAAVPFSLSPKVGTKWGDL